MVYVLGITRKRGDHPGTMQTAGLPDLFAFLPYEHGEQRYGERLVAVEVKAPGELPTHPQVDFAEHCDAAGIAHVIGGFEAVVAWALGEGLIEGTITDFRIPKRRLLPDLERELRNLDAVTRAYRRAFDK